MTPGKDSNHGLPYPIESRMPASPRDGAGEESQPGPRQEVLYLDHVGNHDNPFAALKHIDTLLLIDDSESMQQCWDEVGDIIRIIAPICMKYDDDGIDIEFVNHRASGYFVTGRSGYKNIGFMKGQLDMHDNVAGIYHSVSPRGRCRMDRRLASILDPYLQEYETQLNRSGGKKLIKPLSVIVISDMDWDADQRDHSAITRVARRLGVLGAPRYQVGVQFFRVGQMGRMMDDEAIQFVDDQIWKKRGVRDMVDITTWTGKPGELSADGILKVLLGGVRRSIDFMEV